MDHIPERFRVLSETFVKEAKRATARLLSCPEPQFIPIFGALDRIDRRRPPRCTLP